MRARDFYNPVLGWLLRSPLHGLLSGQMLLLTYTGRRTGRRVATPVNFGRHGDGLVVFSQRDRRWWRNFVGGWPVQIWLHGQLQAGRAHVVQTTPETLSEALRAVHPRLSPAQAAQMAPRCVMLFILLTPVAEATAAEAVHA